MDFNFRRVHKDSLTFMADDKLVILPTSSGNDDYIYRYRAFFAHVWENVNAGLSWSYLSISINIIGQCFFAGTKIFSDKAVVTDTFTYLISKIVKQIIGIICTQNICHNTWKYQEFIMSIELRDS